MQLRRPARFAELHTPRLVLALNENTQKSNFFTNHEPLPFTLLHAHFEIFLVQEACGG